MIKVDVKINCDKYFGMEGVLHITDCRKSRVHHQFIDIKFTLAC
jgi:hypothetical protein